MLDTALVFVVVITCVEMVPFLELDSTALPGTWDGVTFAVAGPGTDEKVEYAHGELPVSVGRAEEYPSQWHVSGLPPCRSAWCLQFDTVQTGRDVGLALDDGSAVSVIDGTAVTVTVLTTFANGGKVPWTAGSLYGILRNYKPFTSSRGLLGPLPIRSLSSGCCCHSTNGHDPESCVGEPHVGRICLLEQ